MTALSSSGAISAKELEQAQQAYDNAQLKLGAAQSDYAIAQRTVLQNIDTAKAQLDQSIAGYEAAKRQAGDLEVLAETVDEVSFFTASVDLEKDPDLRVGLSVEVKTLNKVADNALVIPMLALQFDDNNQPCILYRDENGNAATRYIKVGINDGTYVQVIEGLKARDTILIPSEAKKGFQRPGEMVTEE
ncbi:MAG TPA: hypothetical protein VN549_05870 [Negativicutes bacterium]|nr:hypothetical protein [Negativicutes bacterium]